MKILTLTGIQALLLLSIWGCKIVEEKGVRTKLPDSIQLKPGNPEIFSGIMPCKECGGIKTVLSLNEDHTFSLRQKHEGASAPVFESAGIYRQNLHTGIIRIETVYGVSFPSRIRQGKDKLLVGPGNRNRKATSAAKPAELNAVVPGIKGKLWIFTGLAGDSAALARGSARVPSLKLETGENRFSGFGGCNRIFGNFQLQEGNRITFHQIASTKMACRDENREAAFLELLGIVRSFQIVSDTLELRDAGGQKLGLFQVDYLETLRGD